MSSTNNSNPTSSRTANSFSVGQTVRVQVPTTTDHSTTTTVQQQRGVIATLQPNEEACVLLQTTTSSHWMPPSMEYDNNDNEEEELELTVPLDCIHPLLDFEYNNDNKQDDNKHDKNNLASLEHFKTCGDTLLKLHDEAAALEYYEHVVLTSSSLPSSGLQIGSTVALQIPLHNHQWALWWVDVDCVETDGNDSVVDVTVLQRIQPFGNSTKKKHKKQQQQQLLEQEPEEQTLRIPSSPLRPGSHPRMVWTLHDHDPHHIQVRLLLNSTRCLLKLAHYETVDWKRKQAFFHGALLTTTLVMAMSSSSLDTDEELVHRALELRGRTWLALGQYARALEDCPPQAHALRRDIVQQDQHASKQTRKLVKNMCQWMDGVTTNLEDKEEDNDRNSQEPSPLK